ncbi:MAG: hypothetical protein SNJ82_01585 [Gemmataceae bacterium]
MWDFHSDGLQPLASNRDRLLLAHHREICCIAGRTGQQLARWITRHPIQQALLLDEQTVLSVHATQLEWWQLGQPQPMHIVRLSGHGCGQAFLDPSGQVILVPTQQGIECFTRDGHRRTILRSSEPEPMREGVVRAPLRDASGRVIGLQEFGPAVVCTFGRSMGVRLPVNGAREQQGPLTFSPSATPASDALRAGSGPSQRFARETPPDLA